MNSNQNFTSPTRGASLSGDAPRVVCARLREAGAAEVVLLEGWRADRAAARYSILCCAPRAILTERDGLFYQWTRESDAWTPVEEAVPWLRARYDRAREHSHPVELDEHAEYADLPFISGLVGALGFEFAWHLDRVDAPMRSPRAPMLWVGDFGCAAIYFHDEQGRGGGRWLQVGERDDPAWDVLGGAIEDGAAPTGRGRVFAGTESPRKPALCRSERDGASAYRARVEEAIAAIVERGDLFEVNYAERFEIDCSEGGFALYESLCEVASGEHFGYLQAPGFEIASVSPERFLRVEPGGRVSTRPIKGSMRRSEDPREDRILAEQLLASEKDRAENIMIVDLMRNDLTQVCALGTVKATALCELESFAGIHHLVSTVEGDLAPGFDALDALLASFPAGSITGAPKLRSIEYIANLEGSARGFYTGSLFYASSHGALDSSVLIRTAEIVDGKARYGAGGAVVADSDPERERLEALLKLAPLHRAIGASPDE